MTYHAGLFSRPPVVSCDRCDRCLEVRPVRGGPPAWLAKGKAPPGWATYEDGARRHLCPDCKTVAP